MHARHSTNLEAFVANVSKMAQFTAWCPLSLSGWDFNPFLWKSNKTNLRVNEVCRKKCFQFLLPCVYISILMQDSLKNKYPQFPKIKLKLGVWLMHLIKSVVKLVVVMSSNNVKSIHMFWCLIWHLCYGQ